MDTKQQQASPVLVIGMHRSGTRLLDEMLAALGVFMGADRQADGESATLMMINEAIFHQCGTFWNEPMPVHFVLSQPDLLERATAVARDLLDEQFQQYSGRADWRLDDFPEDAPPFGWKDPRNTFTLPVWRQIFPETRIIHVLRHGIDAAASLVRRHATALRGATGTSIPPALTVMQDNSFGILSSRRGWNLPEAFTMWEQYVEKARFEVAELGDRALEVRFEDLVQRPQDQVPAIAEFCGVAVPDEPLALSNDVDASRAFAFRTEKGLRKFAEAASDILERHGYAP